MTDTDFLQQVAAIVGLTNVFTDPADMAPYLQDWRGRYTGAACCIVRPGDTDEVARILTLCMAHDRPIVPQAGNSGLILKLALLGRKDVIVTNVRYYLQTMDAPPSGEALEAEVAEVSHDADHHDDHAAKH